MNGQKRNSDLPPPTGNNFLPLSPIERFHPRQLVLFGALAGIGVLFLMLTAAYLYSAPAWQWAHFKFPKTFLVSTIVLIAGSGTIRQAQIAYNANNGNALKKWVAYTLWLSLLFVVLQTIGWLQLQNAGIFVAGRPDGSYLYLLTGLHVLHVLTGIVFLGMYYMKLRRQITTGDDVAELLFFSSPIKKINLGLLATYWHFIDALWIYLLLFFLFNHL